MEEPDVELLDIVKHTSSENWRAERPLRAIVSIVHTTVERLKIDPETKVIEGG